MKKIIEYKGKKLEIICLEQHDMPRTYYNYWIREILEKKHWWNFSRKEILHGNTFWWTEEESFEKTLMTKIAEYYTRQEEIKSFDNSVKNFFEENT